MFICLLFVIFEERDVLEERGKWKGFRGKRREERGKRYDLSLEYSLELFFENSLEILLEICFEFSALYQQQSNLFPLSSFHFPLFTS